MDVQKAYDTVEWKALEDTMRELGFPLPSLNGYTMYHNSFFRYLINGKPSPSIQAKCGIRQGDPISPLLFVLIMEYLHRSLRKLKHMPDFNFDPECENLGITNMCFADDLMMFTRGNPVSVQLMMKEFHLFAEATGLVANPTK